MLYSQEKLDQLISCEKLITGKPKKKMSETDGHLRKDMQMISSSGHDRFSVFMRQNSVFQESFSIGLMFHPGDGGSRILLLKCNGPHLASPSGQVSHPHYHFHIHFADSSSLSKGENSCRNVKITQDYGSFEQAQRYFLTKINVQEWEQFFPPIQTPQKLFNDGGEK